MCQKIVFHTPIHNPHYALPSPVLWLAPNRDWVHKMEQAQSFTEDEAKQLTEEWEFLAGCPQVRVEETEVQYQTC